MGLHCCLCEEHVNKMLMQKIHTCLCRRTTIQLTEVREGFIILSKFLKHVNIII